MATKPITRKYTNVSTEEAFQFVFYCDRCGKEWQSAPCAFDMKGFEHDNIRAMLWDKQHEDAYEHANREAGERFIRCPVCGCRVCDDCFYNGPQMETLVEEHGLTMREKEIAVALRKGTSAKRIARELGISPSTVAFHSVNLYRKLNIQSRAELAVMFVFHDPDVSDAENTNKYP